MKLKTIAMTGVLSLAGLGLIGAGAHAAWTTNTTTRQQITSSALSIGLIGPAGSSCNATDPNNGASCVDLSLPSFEVTSSTFSTTPDTVYLENNSDVTPYYEALSAGDTVGGAPGSGSLANEVYLCVANIGGSTIYDGPLSGAVGVTPFASGGTYSSPYSLPSPTQEDSFVMQFYAGPEATDYCNDGNQDPSALDNYTEDGVITPYVTVTNQA